MGPPMLAWNWLLWMGVGLHSPATAIVGIVIGEIIVGVADAVVIDPGRPPCQVLVPLFMFSRMGAPPLTPNSDGGRFLNA